MGNAWLVAFLYLCLSRSTDNPPLTPWLALFAISGWVYGFQAERKRFTALLRAFWPLWMSIFAFFALIVASEVVSNIMMDYVRYSKKTGLEAPLLLCFPVLALLLTDKRRFEWTIGAFAIMSLWHIVSMPIEAIYGWKLFWPGVEPFWIPRDHGILHFQASGLAYKRFYFSGLYLPLFYVAAGVIRSGRALKKWKIKPLWVDIAAALWWIPALCTQSRTTVVCTLAASFVFIAGSRFKRLGRIPVAAWASLPFVIGGGAWMYWALFATDKSGVDMRWGYFVLYLVKSFEWPYLFTGHGTDGDRWPMNINYPEWPYLYHPHNDLADLFWRWGILALGAYLLFWVRTIKITWKEFYEQEEIWPVAALVALFPNMITDLGFTHFEKALFMGIFVAAITAIPMQRRARG